MIDKKSKVAAKSLTAFTLIFMIIISCISAVAVNTNVSEAGANQNLQTVGQQLTQGVDYYLIGDMCSTKWVKDDNYKLTKVDNNHYTGSFSLLGVNTYEFKIVNSNNVYYTKAGEEFTSGSKTVTSLTSQADAANMKLVIPAGTTSITVDMYCEYDGDSRLTMTLDNMGTGGITKGGTGHSYRARDNIYNHSSNIELFSVNSTFFDYYMDEEVDGTWRDSLTGYYRSVKNKSTSDESAAREPFQKFNRAIGQYAVANNWTTPLYFGDFYGKTDGYQGYGVSNLKNFKIRPNNSQATSSGTFGSVSGLADVLLGDNKKLSKNGVAMPYFDKDWLVNNGYGTVISSEFPMRKTTKNNQDYYEFDSFDGKDNCYFDWYQYAQWNGMVMNYGNTSDHSVYDALSGFDNDTDHPGFFPFDRRSDHNNQAYDFGFGMRLDLDFTLGEDGKTNGQDTVFNFSGDDDLWVYLDGVLVLDMGGDHKKSEGCINFSKLKSYVNNIDTSYQATDENNNLVYKKDTSLTGYGYSANFPKLFSDDTTRSGSSQFDNNNPYAHHTLTVFYMERGMIESNLKVGFNFEPISDSLEITKDVDASGVNEKIQEEVKEADDFGFDIQQSSYPDRRFEDQNDKKYTYLETDTVYKAKTNGNTATLGDGDVALFNSQFALKKYLKITESDPKDTLITTMDYDECIFFDGDSENCSWFFDGGAVPVISFDGSSIFNKMYSYTVDGKTIYYYPTEKDGSGNNKAFTIGRRITNTVYNQVKFPPMTENTNFIQVNKWRTATATGENNNSDYSTLSKYNYTLPSGGTSVLNTHKVSGIKYDTKYTVTDTSLNKVVTSGEGKEISSVRYFNANSDPWIATNLRVAYVNTPQVASIAVEKKVVDENGNVISNDNNQFKMKLLLDFDCDGTYEDYGLEGYVSQAQNLVFDKIPVGVHYKIQEESSGGYITKTTFEGEILGESGETVTVTNERIATSIIPSITKTLDGENYTGSAFTFTLKGLPSQTTNTVTTKDTSKVSESVSQSTDGKVTFATLKYNEVGTYWYLITEDKITDNDYQIDTKAIILQVTVSEDNNRELVAEQAYYAGELTGTDYVSLVNDNNLVINPTFENKSTKGEITVLKVDKINDNGTVPDDAKKLAGAEFSLYKVSGNGERTGTLVESKVTDSNGSITFSNLEIFAENGNGNGGAKVYQWYYVVETSAAEGYTLSSNEEWFCFDGATYDNTKNSYTHSFAALNVLITVPAAGINFLMQHNFLLYGSLILGVGTILGCAYMMRRKYAKTSSHSVNKHGMK